MKFTINNRSVNAGNPIANALVVIVGALIIAASLVLGFFAFVVLGAIVLVLGAIISLRVWWLSRKLQRQGPKPPAGGQQSSGGVIEGEYHVVKGDKKP
jgi:membrane protein implicated in regulation of membrane protease activity